MNIFEKILNRHVDSDRLGALLKLPKQYLKEDVLSIIPNMNMTNEGPVLTGIYLVTDSYLCEIKIGDLNNNNFDIVDKRFIRNVRIATDITNVSSGDEVIAVYNTAMVRILHDRNLATEIEFVGEERDQWLDAVLGLIPASFCLQPH